MGANYNKKHWVLEDGEWNYTFIVIPGDPKDSSSQENEEAFHKHLLLEFLASLKIIRYERGYDGYYYDIYMKARR